MPRAGMPEVVPPRLPGSTGSALGFFAGIAATLVAFPLGADDWPPVALVLLGLVVLVVGLSTTLLGALAGAAQCWGLYSGFVLHQFGELHLDGPGRVALVLLAGLAVTASVAGLALRAHAVKTGSAEPARARLTLVTASGR